MSNKFITPETKISDLLNNFPEIEGKLIELAPTFKKLKNPILRKTIAKVTTLRQAAIVGNLRLDFLINELRKAAGQSEADFSVNTEEIIVDAPDWFSMDKIKDSLDAVPIINSGGHPLDRVIKSVRDLKEDEIFELITPFIPAPLIENVENLGFKSWTNQVDNEFFKTYFIRTK